MINLQNGCFEDAPNQVCLQNYSACFIATSRVQLICSCVVAHALISSRGTVLGHNQHNSNAEVYQLNLVSERATADVSFMHTIEVSPRNLCACHAPAIS